MSTHRAGYMLLPRRLQLEARWAAAARRAAATRQKTRASGKVEAWGRSADNLVGGWYGLRKGYRGRFGMYLPPLLEELGLARVEHHPETTGCARSDDANMDIRGTRTAGQSGRTVSSGPRAKSPTSSRRSPLQNRPGSNQLTGRFGGSRPMASYALATSSAQ
jgi:hypothetical protein